MMNGRRSTLDVQHRWNHRYDPTGIQSKETWTRDTINAWMAAGNDDVASLVSSALTDAGEDRSICERAVCAAVLAYDGTVIPEGAVQASLRKWRVNADLDIRLNCPFCNERDDNNHYLSFCREPTVVAARAQHYALLTAAIHACKLKKSTACVFAAIYTLDDAGRHVDPRSGEIQKCEDLVDRLLDSHPRAKPARGGLVDLLEMGPAERTQEWFPRTFAHGMYPLGEDLGEIRSLQARVVVLAMEAEMWTARCRIMHPGGSTGKSQKATAADRVSTGKSQKEVRTAVPARQISDERPAAQHEHGRASQYS